ncbi:hypothetical protein ACKS0A_00215 [Histoplasma ohiense]
MKEAGDFPNDQIDRIDLSLLRFRRSPTFYFWILIWLDDVDSCRMDWSRCRAVCVTWWWIFIPWILNGDLALHAIFFCFFFFLSLGWACNLPMRAEIYFQSQDRRL